MWLGVSPTQTPSLACMRADCAMRACRCNGTNPQIRQVQWRVPTVSGRELRQESAHALECNLEAGDRSLAHSKGAKPRGANSKA